MRRTAAPLLAAALGLLTACARPPGPIGPLAWPGAAWEEVTPEAQGVAPGGLADLLERVEREGLHLHALLVVRGGRVVLESYAWPFDAETPHDIASCTKSVVGLLAGAALADGRLAGLDARLVDLLPGRTITRRSGHKEAVTLRHLLTMTSGLENLPGPAEPTLQELLAAPDAVQFAVERRLERAAGERWSYDSASTHLVAAILTAAVGQDLADWARERLFAPIGVGPVEWPADAQGIRHGWGDLRLRPRDMARLGLLLLRGGRWEGRPVLPADWVAAATRDQAGGAEGAPEGGYGYLWWVGPRDTFFAAGRGGQHIFVAPALDLVVVTTAGEGPQGTTRFAALLEEHLLPAVGAEVLPPDPAGRARLAAVVARRAAAPPAGAVPPLGERAAAVSGRVIELPADAPFGWRALTLELDPARGAEAALTIALEGSAERFAVGLDGVPRLTRGARLTDLPRHAGATVALTGRWEGERRFVVDFDTLGSIERGTLALQLDDDGVSLAVAEATLGAPPVVVRGTLR